MTEIMTVKQNTSQRTNYLQQENGWAYYDPLRTLPDQSVAGVSKMIFTWALCVDMDSVGWARRYCYETKKEAVDALNALTSKGDEPSGWLAKRPQD